jgi:hypothetical protein
MNLLFRLDLEFDDDQYLDWFMRISRIAESAATYRGYLLAQVPLDSTR